MAAFFTGAIFSISTVLWSVKTTPELPLSESELAELRKRPAGVKAIFREIVDAIREMPLTMRQLWWMKLFQWYGMLCYWIYIVPALALTLFHTSDPTSTGFRDASLVNGQIGGFYNAVAFVAALCMVPLAKRYGPKIIHAICLITAGISMMAIPEIQQVNWLFVPMIGVGLAWGSIMGNPYIILANSIPAHRAGIYMGIFNMFIVIPMIIQMITLPLYYHSLLAGNPANVIRLAGILLILAALAVLRVNTKAAQSEPGDIDILPSLKEGDSYGATR
jgi:maltose/moltooligosaccharide transporter